MKEQSQIDDMRAAIRGDIERGRTRPRPTPVVQPDADEELVEETPREATRPGLLSSFFKRS